VLHQAAPWPVNAASQVGKTTHNRLAIHLDLELCYAGAVQKRILLQGRMYVFEQHVCFHCNLFGYIKDTVIPLKVSVTGCECSRYSHTSLLASLGALGFQGTDNGWHCACRMCSLSRNVRIWAFPTLLRLCGEASVSFSPPSCRVRMPTG
jgi:hypothetical protein